MNAWVVEFERMDKWMHGCMDEKNASKHGKIRMNG